MEVTYTQGELEALLDIAKNEAKKEGMIEALHLALRIKNSAYSEGSYRVAIYNHILKLQGRTKEFA